MREALYTIYIYILKNLYTDQGVKEIHADFGRMSPLKSSGSCFAEVCAHSLLLQWRRTDIYKLIKLSQKNNQLKVCFSEAASGWLHDYQVLRFKNNFFPDKVHVLIANYITKHYLPFIKIYVNLDIKTIYLNNNKIIKIFCKQLFLETFHIYHIKF